MTKFTKIVAHAASHSSRNWPIAHAYTHLTRGTAADRRICVVLGWIVLWELAIVLLCAQSFDRSLPSFPTIVRVQKRSKKAKSIRKVRSQSARLPLLTAQYFLPKKNANKFNDIGVFPMKRGKDSSN